MARLWKRTVLAFFSETKLRDAVVSRLSAVAVALLVGCGTNSEPQTAPPVQPEESPRAAEPASITLPALSEAIPESSHRFRLQLKGDVATSIQDAPEVAVIANTVMQYQWVRKGDALQLFLASQKASVEMSGQLMMDSTISRHRFSMRNEEGLTDIAFEDASPELQQMLIDTYEKPLCRIRVDDYGRELERHVSTNPGAKIAIANGGVENARVCHPPFPGTNTWEAACTISMGNGSFTRGNLRYQVVGDRSEDNTTKVSVSGQLTGSGRQGALEIRDAVYAVRGNQVYDIGKREWVEADLHLDVNFGLYQDAKKVGQASGTMNLTMSIQDPESTVQD